MSKRDYFDVIDKVILVTGASGHLGAAMCHHLAENGAKLLLLGRNKENLEALQKDLKNPETHEVLVCDITDQDAVFETVSDLKKRHEKLDGIVNNAVQPMVGNLESISWEQASISNTQNITAPLFFMIELRDLLSKSSSPSIVNIASMYGMVSPDPRIYGDSSANNPAFYGAGKAGLIQLTRYMACHLAEDQIRVNAISPGPFPRPDIRESQPEFHDKLAGKVPLGRIGRAEELAPVVQFLLSDASSYMTGTNIPVDGGWTAW